MPPPRRLIPAVSVILLAVVVAVVTRTPWPLLAIPGAVFLLVIVPSASKATSQPHTVTARMSLEAYPRSLEDAPSGIALFRLVLRNHDEISAAGARVRLVIPARVVPVDSRIAPLGTVLVGTLGRDWVIQTLYDATTVTWHMGDAGSSRAITCPGNGSIELADLQLPAQGVPYHTRFEYQISGGNVRAMLGMLDIQSVAPVEN